MSQVTIRLLDGSDRGRVYENLEPPITVGREEGNSIQLNDERISRFHLKIQRDHDKMVLTDLQSTNGTKVNGEDVQLRILRYGDMISVGRSVLLIGSREEVASRLAELRGSGGLTEQTMDEDSSAASVSDSGESLEFELNWSEAPDLQATLHVLDPPEIPDRLSPAQAAQLSELLEYVHIRMRNLFNTVQSDEKAEQVLLGTRQWQDLIDLQARLAEYLRAIGEPGGMDDP